MKRRQSGSTLIEYALATAAVVLALMAPVPPDGQSVFEYLLDAVRASSDHVDASLALP